MQVNHIARLIAYAARWGISVEIDPDWYKKREEGLYKEFDTGPTCYNIVNWDKAPRIVSSKHDAWPFLLHEIAHCICPSAPAYVLEHVVSIDGT